MGRSLVIDAGLLENLGLPELRLLHSFRSPEENPVRFSTYRALRNTLEQSTEILDWNSSTELLRGS